MPETRQARWRRNHPDEARERCRLWRAKNRAKVAEYNKQWDEQHPDYQRPNALDSRRKYRAANREKLRARDAVMRAIETGKLKRQPCEVCGSPEAHAHHDDYSLPLVIRWLCVPHHFNFHYGYSGANT